MGSSKCRPCGLRRLWDSRRRRGATTCPGEVLTRSLLPYRPRHGAAAGCSLLTPRCAAPWRGAPGTAETERRRVGAQRPALAGRSTITALSALSGRPRQPASAARRPLPGQGGSGGGFGTAPQRGTSRSRPESAWGILPGPAASHQLRRLRGIRPPRTLCSSSSFLDFSLNSSPTPQRAFPTRAPAAPRAATSQRTGALLPAVRSGRPGAWLPTRKSRPLGSAGAARDPSVPRCPLQPRLPSDLCVRAANPSAEPFQRRRLGSKKRVKGRARAKQGTGGGQKATALTLGRFRHVAAFGLLVVSPLPRLPRPAKGRSEGGQGRSGSARTELEMVLPELQGRGSKTVLVWLRIFRGTRRLEKDCGKARERGRM